MPGRKNHSTSVAISAIGQSQCRQPGGGGGAVGVGLSPGGGGLGCLLIGHSYAFDGAFWSCGGLARDGWTLGQAVASSAGWVITSTRAPLRSTVISSGLPIASLNISRCRS